MKINNIKVYKCSLLIIAEDARINIDQSKRKNIKHAKKEAKKELLVQPTMSRHYFREIVTNQKIPVYRIQNLGASTIGELIYHYPPKEPYFIQYDEIIENEEYLGNSLQEASLKEIQDYLDNNDPDILSKEIQEIMNQAEQNYQKAKDKKEISDQAKIKQLLKQRK